MSSKKRGSSRCPAIDCSKGNPAQHDAAPGLIATGVQGDWVMDAHRCTYCGCVYTGFRDARIIKGYLNNGVRGAGWHPIGT